ncbi:MAG: hypothetical protein GF364_13860, partial [Candidatus Lokiarchaeota archaeon]|nr:hypothetical protein [Candidatus Lokiarchaeota archaeon]
MKINFLTNIGNRDIKFCDEPDITDLREYTKKYFEKFKSTHDYNLISGLSFPIIQPFLDHFRTENDNTELEIIFYYFCTDQEDISQFSHKDTIYIGKLAKVFTEYYLKEYDIKCSGNICILKKAPVDFQLMFKEYTKHIEQISNKIMTYISITQSTTAMIHGLLHASVQHFKTHLTELYLKEGTSQVVTYDVASRLIKKDFKIQLETLLEHHDYDLAYDLAKTYNLETDSEKLMDWQLNSLKLRFFYKEMQKITKNHLVNCEGNRKHKYINLLEKLEHAMKMYSKHPDDACWWSNTRKTLNEDYFNVHIFNLENLNFSLKVKLDQKYYSDFLSRLFRYIEAALRLVFEVIYHKSTDLIKDKLSIKLLDKLPENVILETDSGKISVERLIQGQKKEVEVHFSQFVEFLIDHPENIDLLRNEMAVVDTQVLIDILNKKSEDDSFKAQEKLKE